VCVKRTTLRRLAIGSVRCTHTPGLPGTRVPKGTVSAKKGCCASLLVIMDLPYPRIRLDFTKPNV